MEGNTMVQNKPGGNAIFPCEYTNRKGSTAARSLIVYATTPINYKKMCECQSKPLAVSTFYYFFIEWYVSHYNKIRDSLAEKLFEHRQKDFTISPRLWETQFCLQTAYRLFLHYCFDKNFISIETAREEYNTFNSVLIPIIQAQNERINPAEEEKESQSVNYFKLIRELYKGNRFKLAPIKKEFDTEKHDGLIDKDLLCLRSDKLLAKIQKFFSTATLGDIKKALIEKNALKLDSENKNHKIGQKRFYGIKLDKLQ